MVDIVCYLIFNLKPNISVTHNRRRQRGILSLSADEGKKKSIKDKHREMIQSRSFSAVATLLPTLVSFNKSHFLLLKVKTGFQDLN